MCVMSAVTVAFALPLLIVLQSWINRRQPQPYMDELFHVPQAQEFCAKAIARRIPVYHPSITTLPGLYLPNTILAFVLSSSRVCSTSWLRATSALAALLCFPLLVKILKSLRDRHVSATLHTSAAAKATRSDLPDHDTHTCLMALIIWLHPVFLFYATLYYTDTSSIFWLLMTWYCSLKGRTHASALCGVLSTLTRQTNMVWHAFIVTDAVIYDIIHRKPRAQTFWLHSINQLPRIAMQNIGHAVAFVLYITFLIWNRGVAVGDKLHHEVTLHYAMIPYFLGFHTASYMMFQILVPRLIPHDLRSLRRMETAIFFMGNCFVLAALVIATGDRVHPFILADNRHFTFYVYRRWLLRSSLQRLVLVPLYAWSILGCYNEFSFRKTFQERRVTGSQSPCDDAIFNAEWILDGILFACACVTLTPSGLLEPRYFTAANLVLTVRRISRKRWRSSVSRMALMSALCVFLNVAVIFIFAEMPFERPPDAHMPLDKSPGRFMF